MHNALLRAACTCRERVHPLLQDGMIMITWANHHYLDFAKTWIYHVKKVGMRTAKLAAAAVNVHCRCTALSGS